MGLYMMADSLQGSDFCVLYSYDFSLCSEITKNVTYLMNLHIFYKLIKQKIAPLLAFIEEQSYVLWVFYCPTISYLNCFFMKIIATF